jgi:hypothetical protein
MAQKAPSRTKPGRLPKGRCVSRTLASLDP